METSVTVVETRTEVKSWGSTWKMVLEKYVSPSGKTAKYMIYHHGGQSYPVGEFRSLKAARRVLDSFSNYKVASIQPR